MHVLPPKNQWKQSFFREYETPNYFHALANDKSMDSWTSNSISTPVQPSGSDLECRKTKHSLKAKKTLKQEEDMEIKTEEKMGKEGKLVNFLSLVPIQLD